MNIHTDYIDGLRNGVVVEAAGQTMSFHTPDCPMSGKSELDLKLATRATTRDIWLTVPFVTIGLLGGAWLMGVWQ